MQNILFLQCAPFGLDCFWWWLFSALAFLLGAFLYWLLFCRSKDEQIAKLTKERDDFHNERNKIDSDYQKLQYQLEEQQKELDAAKQALRLCDADKAVLQTKLNRFQAEADDGSTASETPTDRSVPADYAGTEALGAIGAANVQFDKLFTNDNLQIVEGIGPKIESYLKENGISSWAELAATNPDRIKELLEAGGNRFRLAKPESWPRQAELARDGKWDELIEYQQFLSAGKTASTGGNASAVQKLAMAMLGYNMDPNDLKVIEGIGPKIEQLLKDAGIPSWAALADTSVERLQEILTAAGDRYRLAKPDTWPKQAELARDAKWSELKEYQDFLTGGRG